MFAGVVGAFPLAWLLARGGLRLGEKHTDAQLTCLSDSGKE